jgi:hypothetical protein
MMCRLQSCFYLSLANGANQGFARLRANTLHLLVRNSVLVKCKQSEVEKRLLRLMIHEYSMFINDFRFVMLRNRNITCTLEPWANEI